MSLLRPMLAALVLTLLLEALTAFLLTHSGLAAAAGAAGNLLTNPFISACSLYGIPLWMLLVLECAAVLAEALLYRLLAGLPPRRALCLSLSANAVSFLFGSWLLNTVLF